MSADKFEPTDPSVVTGDDPEGCQHQEVPKVSARNLLGKHKVLKIEHNGCEYVLRLTRNDKLILTK